MQRDLRTLWLSVTVVLVNMHLAFAGVKAQQDVSPGRQHAKKFSQSLRN